MQNKTPNKKEKPTIPIMELLAFNATASSRQLLKKHGKEDAKGYEDLTKKLADLYYSATDKKEVEKEFAEIHPHRDFILKYLCPPPPKTKVILPEPTSSAEGLLENKKPNHEFLIASVSIVAIVGLVIYSTWKQK